MPEEIRYGVISRKDLCQVLGLTAETLEQWEREGCPVGPDGIQRAVLVNWLLQRAKQRAAALYPPPREEIVARMNAAAATSEATGSQL